MKKPSLVPFVKLTSSTFKGEDFGHGEWSVAFYKAPLPLHLHRKKPASPGFLATPTYELHGNKLKEEKKKNKGQSFSHRYKMKIHISGF